MEQQSLGLNDFIPQRIAWLVAEQQRLQGAIDELRRLQALITVTPKEAKKKEPGG